MLKCKICGRQTPQKEPTAKFMTYRKVRNEGGRDGREAESEIPVCFNCRGEVLKK